MTGKEDKDVVQQTVIVGVIFLEVHTGVMRHLAGFGDHIVRVNTVVITRIASVIFHFFAQFVRTVAVELRQEDTVRRSDIEIATRTGSTVMVISRLIEQILEILQTLSHLEIRKTDEQYETVR